MDRFRTAALDAAECGELTPRLPCRARRAGLASARRPRQHTAGCCHDEDAHSLRSSLKIHRTARQVAEGDFLEVVTSTPRVVCHFFHANFERCKLLDAHLAALARRFFDTRFIRLSAPVRGPGRSRAACVRIG